MERRSTPILGRTGRGGAVAARESFQMMPPARRHYAYLLRCGDGTYYAGYTVHPGRRLAAHRRGRASRYTRGRGPHTYVAVFWCPTKRSRRSELPEHRSTAGSGCVTSSRQGSMSLCWGSWAGRKTVRWRLM